jgi:hypothetical protein
MKIISSAYRMMETAFWDTKNITARLHNEELHNLYSAPNVISVRTSRKMRRPEHVARVGEKRNAYKILIGQPER